MKQERSERYFNNLEKEKKHNHEYYMKHREEILKHANERKS